MEYAIDSGRMVMEQEEEREGWRRAQHMRLGRSRDVESMRTSVVGREGTMGRGG
jgi:hypothetical protein